MNAKPCFQCRTDSRERVFCCDECRLASEGKAKCATCGGKCDRSAIPMRSGNQRPSVCSHECFEAFVHRTGDKP